MNEYGKTENLYVRDQETHLLIPGEYRVPEVALVSRWLVTEKIDGTNVRILLKRSPYALDCYDVELRGRSDKATLPKDLRVELTQDAIHSYFEMFDIPDDVVITLYGEAYGPGIQKGGGYADEKKIAVFDLMTSRPILHPDGGVDIVGWNHSWRSWSEMTVAASMLGLDIVPVLSLDSPILEIYEEVAHGFSSVAALENGMSDGLDAEGVVCKTDPYLFRIDHGRFERVMFKLKTKDLRTD